jgi:hypothetical protein
MLPSLQHKLWVAAQRNNNLIAGNLLNLWHERGVAAERNDYPIVGKLLNLRHTRNAVAIRNYNTIAGPLLRLLLHCGVKAKTAQAPSPVRYCGCCCTVV